MVVGHARTALAVLALSGPGGRGEWPAAESAAERGRIALTATGYLKPAWGDARLSQGRHALEGAVPRPTPRREPEAYAAAFNRRYGLHPAPYPNDGLPMGLRRGNGPDGTKTGHPDRLHGLPRRLDRRDELRRPGQHARSTCKPLLDELTRADGRRLPPVAVHPEHVARDGQRRADRGRPAQPPQHRPVAAAIFPLPLGASFPEWTSPPGGTWPQGDDVLRRPHRRPLGPHRTCSSCSARSRSSEFKELEPTFRDIQAYLKSLEPPKYPFAIDAARADRGEVVFEETCAQVPRHLRPGRPVSERDRRART